MELVIIALVIFAVYLTGGIISGIIGYAVGKQKDQAGLGFILGFFMPGFGILIAALLQDNRPKGRKGAYYHSLHGRSYSQYRDQKNTSDWLKNLN